MKPIGPPRPVLTNNQSIQDQKETLIQFKKKKERKAKLHPFSAKKVKSHHQGLVIQFKKREEGKEEGKGTTRKKKMKSHQVLDQPQPGKNCLREKKKPRKKKKNSMKKGNLTGWWFNPSKAKQGRHPVCQVHETPGLGFV